MKIIILSLILVSSIGSVFANPEVSVSNEMENTITIHVQDENQQVCNSRLINLEKQIRAKQKITIKYIPCEVKPEFEGDFFGRFQILKL